MSTPSYRSLDRRNMRLPGSVAEVEASPPGPKVGAFFDLDGTLVAGFTGVIMTQDRFRRREIGVGEFLGVVQAALNHQLGRADFEQLIYRGASMMKGRSVEDIEELGESNRRIGARISGGGERTQRRRNGARYQRARHVFLRESSGARRPEATARGRTAQRRRQ